MYNMNSLGGLDSEKGNGRRPRIMIIGSDDVHRRIDLMRLLVGRFRVSAVGSKRELADVFAEAGFPFHYYPLKREPSPFTDLRAFFALYALFRRERPDVVHAFTTKPTVWARLAARAAGVPVVLGTLSGLGSLYASDRFRMKLLRVVYEPLQKLACTVSDLTIFQNEDDAEEFVAAGIAPEEKATVVPGSGIRTNHFDAKKVDTTTTGRIRSELGAVNGTVLVTMVSRLIRSKGILDYARAAGLVRKTHANVEFVLVGPVDSDSLDRLDSDELEEVQQSVNWLGKRSDVREILASSDIFALPTYYREGVPRVLLEAASTGLPLVATKVAGCDIVAQHGANALLVEPRSSTELADAISKLVDQPDLRARFSGNSRDLAVANFDVSVIAAKTEGIYWRLLNGKKRNPAASHLNPSRGSTQEALGVPEV